MDIDVYRNFLTVVSCGTISEAARQLNMTQPALSMQIKGLQNNLGEILLEKHQGTHVLELTSAGRMVYKKAIEICGLEDTLLDEIKQRDAGLRGMLDVNVLSWEDDVILKRIIPAFHQQYPLVKYFLSRIDKDGVCVSCSQCDIRIIKRQDLPEHEKKFDIIYCDKIEPYAVVCEDNKWFPKDVETISPKMLSCIPLACRHNDIGKSIVNMLNHNGCITDVVIWANFRRGMLKTAESGMVVGLVLGKDDEVEYPKLRFVPLINNTIDYCYVISKPHGMKFTPLLQRFVDFAVDYKKTLSKEKI